MILFSVSSLSLTVTVISFVIPFADAFTVVVPAFKTKNVTSEETTAIVELD